MEVKLDIKPYLKYCKGWQAQYTIPDTHRKVVCGCCSDEKANEFFVSVLPIGRRLSSMTFKEQVKFYWMLLFPNRTTDMIAWLLDKEFWIFGDEYFDAGLVIEKQIKI